MKMNENKLITPRKLQGFWELMPKEQILFDGLLNKLEEVFKQHCFVPLDTPVLEYSEALLAKSGGETDKQVFRFTKGDTDMCMRYDLTVPLARFVAMHQNELSFPFKRYQIGKVYRGERAQKGRFREFYQCDADIIGDGELSYVADAECIALFEKCYEALGIDVEIRISNREILSGFFQELNKTNLSSNILTILDKLEKIGLDETKILLKEIELTEEEIDKLLYLATTKGTIDEISSKLENFCSNELFQTGLAHLKELDRFLKSLGAKKYVYDLLIIRGHDYYTGVVFEAFKKDTNIALGGGGRFENLCSYFSNKKLLGVGMSIGITRIFDLLMKEQSSSVNEIECAIINFDDTLNEGLSLMASLREKEIKADMFYENKSFKSKMKEANKRQVKYVIIVGEDEVKSKLYTLKNMETSEQEQLPLEKIVEKIKSDRMCN